MHHVGKKDYHTIRDGTGIVIKRNFDRKYFVRRHQIVNSVANIFVFACYMLQQRVFVYLKTQNIIYTFYERSVVTCLIARQLLEHRTNRNCNHLNFSDLFNIDFPFTNTSSLMEQLIVTCRWKIPLGVSYHIPLGNFVVPLPNILIRDSRTHTSNSRRHFLQLRC